MSVNKSVVEKFFAEIEKHTMLCQACGMCEGVCPVDAVVMKQNFASQFVPNYNAEKCIGCGKCVEACCSRANAANGKSVVGPYRKIYIGKSTRQKYMENGSSGGVITTLLEYGMRNHVFEEVLTVSNDTDAVVARPGYVKTIEKEQGSKYVSAPLCSVYDKGKKNLAVTALPCQVKAIKKQNENHFVFGLFCSKLSLEDLIVYIAKQNNRDRDDISSVNYRQGTWPGNFIMKFSDKTEMVEKYNRSKFNAAYNSYNFSGAGCLLCDDYFSEQADISFGDPWGRKQYEENYLGETIIIARSERGLKLVEDAIAAGVIEAREFELEKLIKGHLKEIYNKKTALIQRMEYIKCRTDAMKNYDTSVLMQAKNFSLLNRYAMYNNWERRKSEKRYRCLFVQPIKLMFLTRFLHAFLLGRVLKKSGNFTEYLRYAESEKVGVRDV